MRIFLEADGSIESDPIDYPIDYRDPTGIVSIQNQHRRGGPTASHFRLLRQTKVTQGKATLLYRPSGSFGRTSKLGGCGTRPSVAHKTCHAAELEQSSPSSQFCRPPS